MKKEKKKGIITVKDKFGYMLGDVGCNMVLSLCNSYLLIFYTKALGVSAAIIGTVMMAAKFIDAITDMSMGRINDVWCDKKGDRFRPWIAYGSVPLVIASCSMYAFFLADAAYIVKVIWLVVTYIIFGSVCYTMVNIPYGAMSNVITPDADERTSLSTWRMMGSTGGGLVLGIVIPMVIYMKDADGNTIVDGSRFFTVAVFVGILALVCLYTCYFLSKERVKGVLKKEENREKTGLLGTLKVMKGCYADRSLLMIFLASVFLNFGINTYTLYNQYVFLDYFNNTSLSGISALFMAVGMFLAAPIVGPLSKKFGKKEIIAVGTAVASLVMFAISFIMPKTPGLYMVTVFLTFLGLGMSMVEYSLLNDCVDDHFIKTGDQVAGTAYGINTFMQKLSGALCTGVGGWMLTFIGYNELAVVQAENVQKSVFLLSTRTMGVSLGLCALCLALVPMNKKKTKEVAEKMATIRGEQAEQEEA